LLSTKIKVKTQKITAYLPFRTNIFELQKKKENSNQCLWTEVQRNIEVVEFGSFKLTLLLLLSQLKKQTERKNEGTTIFLIKTYLINTFVPKKMWLIEFWTNIWCYFFVLKLSLKQSFLVNSDKIEWTK
jgi:hypothetical protein